MVIMTKNVITFSGDSRVHHRSENPGYAQGCRKGLLKPRFLVLLKQKKTKKPKSPNFRFIKIFLKKNLKIHIFSERELKFMFAICHRRSVCLSVVCL